MGTLNWRPRFGDPDFGTPDFGTLNWRLRNGDPELEITILGPTLCDPELGILNWGP
jgi:hypothetical protein